MSEHPDHVHLTLGDGQVPSAVPAGESAPGGDMASTLQERPLPCDAWQPIENAPKDGRVLLGWVVAGPDDFGIDGFEAPSLIHWDKGFKSSVGGRGPGWAKQWRGEVTHWMPLPAAPTRGGSHYVETDPAQGAASRLEAAAGTPASSGHDDPEPSVGGSGRA